MPKPAKSRLGEIHSLRNLLKDSSCHDISGQFRVLLQVLKVLPEAKKILDWIIHPDLSDEWNDLVEKGDTSVLEMVKIPDCVTREISGDSASMGMLPVCAGLSKREVLAIMRVGSRYNQRIGIDGSLALLALEKAATEKRDIPYFLMLPLLQALYGACENGGAAGFRSVSRLFERRTTGGESGGDNDDTNLWTWHVLDYLLSYESDEYSAKEIEESFPPRLVTTPNRAQIVSFCERWGCRCRPT